MLAVFHPPSSCTVRRSTPAMTRSAAHLCRLLWTAPSPAMPRRLPSAAAPPSSPLTARPRWPRRDPRNDRALPNGAAAPLNVAATDRSVDRVLQVGGGGVSEETWWGQVRT